MSGASGWAPLTARHSPGKIASTMQLGNWASYAYRTWSRPAPSLSG